jgi:hypothetical protein
MEKFCNICKLEKEIILFPKKGSVCKNCLSIRNKIWRQNNKDNIKEYYQKWYDEHRNDRIVKCRNYYHLNKDEISNQKKQSYIYNKDEILQKNRNWRKSNKKQLNERAKFYNKKKRKENIDFKIKSILRCRLCHLVKNKNRSMRTLELIGCSLEKLKEHLQQTAIQNGYLDFNINNYNGKDFHIDHIIPCSAFNLKCSYHQKICFNWSNLQILYCLANEQKGDTICWNF